MLYIEEGVTFLILDHKDALVEREFTLYSITFSGIC